MTLLSLLLAVALAADAHPEVDASEPEPELSEQRDEEAAAHVRRYEARMRTARAGLITGGVGVGVLAAGFGMALTAPDAQGFPSGQFFAGLGTMALGGGVIAVGAPIALGGAHAASASLARQGRPVSQLPVQIGWTAVGAAAAISLTPLNRTVAVVAWPAMPLLAYAGAVAQMVGNRRVRFDRSRRPVRLFADPRRRVVSLTLPI